jgi:alpha-beta hydrolase superfamily lysophospholipase
MRTARDGTELHLHAHPLDGARATIAVVHGYGEHGGRYDHVAAAWRERGLQSFAIDVRGHGRSRGPRGFVERFTDYHADLDVLLDVAREAARGGPLFLFGHSNGALLALHYLIARGGEGLRGLMLSSPFLAVALPVPKPKVLLGKIASRLVPGLALPAGLEGRHVTRDPELARLYDTDPLNNKNATARWFTEATAAADLVVERAGALTLPTILLYGGADQVVDAARTDVLASKLTMSDRTVERLAGHYHELVNEPPPDRARVIARYADWALARS